MAEDSWMQNRNPSPSGFPIHYTKRLRYNLDIELFLIPSENPFTLKYFLFTNIMYPSNELPISFPKFCLCKEENL